MGYFYMYIYFFFLTFLICMCGISVVYLLFYLLSPADLNPTPPYVTTVGISYHIPDHFIHIIVK